MKLTVTVEPGDKNHKIDVQKNKSVSDIIQKLDMKPDGVIVLRNNIPIPIDESITTEDPLKIIRVASGG